jgi:magnesium-transporting ATPase (P-type)
MQKTKLLNILLLEICLNKSCVRDITLKGKMNENINQKTAKFPFWILYLISTFIIIFDLIYTHSFLSNNPQALEGNPLNAYFASIFGNNYFLAIIPIVLILLYGAGKLVGWIIRRYYPKSQIKGENYTMIVVILLTLPNVLFNEVFAMIFDIKPMLSFRGALVFGLILMMIYIIITEIADSKATKDISKV